MNDKKIIDKKEVYNNFLDRAVNMAKQGKRQNILTPGFYDAVRIGKDFFDLSQEEVYDEIERRLNGEMQELIVPEASEEDVERQKEMNKELDTTLDTQKQINDLQKEASDEDVARQEKMKDAVDATTDSIEKATSASEKSDVAEKIAHKVREKLNKESLEEGKKESTADIKQRIKDLVQKLKDQNDHLYPEGAKDLAIDMIKKMDIKEMDLRKGDVVKFKDGSKIIIVGPKGDGYDYMDGNEKGHHPAKWFAKMLSTGKATLSEATKEEETEFHKKLDKLVHDTFGKRKEELGEAKLDFMGTADEETMKYLLQDIGREELVNFEKQFVEMFELLRDIRYDGSEQLSKGASEISQRIHNFITIFRQALKGNPVVKEETIDEGFLDQKSPQEIKRMHKTLKDAATLINTLKFYGTDKQQMLADKIHGTGGMYKLMFTLQDELDKREGAIDEGKTKSLTNNHSNPVLEAAKKKLVDRINSIALKEGISKKEATIRVVKALQESK